MAPEFYFRAKNAAGELIKGTQKADSRLDVADQIQKQGYYVVGIEKKKDLDLKMIMNFFGRIRTKDLFLISRQFSVLIQAGVPIVQCLDLLIEQTESKNLRSVLQEIFQDVEVGTSFSDALARHDHVFPVMYSKMVHAGEVGGILDVVMGRLADFYERESEMGSKIRSAMAYPIVVLCIALSVMAFLMISVVPVFADLFSSMGGTLPLPTRIVLGISQFIGTYWYLIAIFIFILVVSVGSYIKSPSGKYKFHQLQLKLPIIGKLVTKIEVARFTRTLGSLLRSGVPLMESLRVVEKIITNQVIANRLIEARAKVREGINLSEPLMESGVFPKVMIQMLVVGEETGTLDQMLEKIAHFYERETENAIQTAMTLIEPLLIVMMAVFIGSVVVAIIMPMFNMVNLL